MLFQVGITIIIILVVLIYFDLFAFNILIGDKSLSYGMDDDVEVNEGEKFTPVDQKTKIAIDKIITDGTNLFRSGVERFRDYMSDRCVLAARLPGVIAAKMAPKTYDELREMELRMYGEVKNYGIPTRPFKQECKKQTPLSAYALLGYKAGLEYVNNIYSTHQ